MIYNTTLAKPGDDCTTLDGSRLHVIKFKNSSIQGVRNGKTYKIDYSIIVQDLDTPDEVVFFKSSCADINFTNLIKMDMQRFTDEVFLAIQKKKLPDTTDYVGELKTESISVFGDTLLKQEGEMTLDTEYKAFGYIYSELDKIGTFEKIKFTSNDQISLVDTFSIVPLDKTENLSLEYSLEGKKYIGVDPKYVSENTLRVCAIEIADVNNIEEVPVKESFGSYEDFLNHRKGLLNIDAGNNNLSIDEFDDLF